MTVSHARPYLMPNTEVLFWVDLSVQDVFLPNPSKGDRVPPKK